VRWAAVCTKQIWGSSGSHESFCPNLWSGVDVVFALTHAGCFSLLSYAEM
jgi:hypothetical protein